MGQWEHGGSNSQFLLYSPDGSCLAAILPRGLQLFQSNGERIGHLESPVSLVGFSPYSQFLVIGRGDQLESLSCRDLGARDQVISGFRNHTTQSNHTFWLNPQAGFLLPRPECDDYPAYPYRYALSPSGARVALLGDRRVKIMDLKTWTEIWGSQQQSRDITTVTFLDEQSIAYGTMGGSVFFDDIQTGKTLARTLLDGEIRSLTALRPGLVAAGCADLSSTAFVIKRSGDIVAFANAGRETDVWALDAQHGP